MVQNKYLCGVSRGTRSRLQRLGGRVCWRRCLW